MSNDLQTAITEAQRISARLWQLCVDKHEGDEAMRLMGQAHRVVLQHLNGIVLLTKVGRSPASALALYRPLVDTFVRGNYLGCFAYENGNETERLKKFNASEGLGAWSEMLRKLDGYYETTYFSQFDGGTWSTMCDFTHSGPQQLRRNLTDDGKIGDAYPIDEMVRLVSSATKVTLSSAFFFFRETHNAAGAELCREWMRSISDDPLLRELLRRLRWALNHKTARASTNLIILSAAKDPIQALKARPHTSLGRSPRSTPPVQTKG